MPADSLGIPGSIYWMNMPDTPPVATSNANQAYLFIQKKKKEQSLELISNLSAGTAVMASPGERELARADHTHGRSQIWNPDRSFRAQR